MSAKLTLARNTIQYVAAWKPSLDREALYVGDPAGRQYSEAVGVALGSHEGNALATDQVLIVRPAGGRSWRGTRHLLAPGFRPGATCWPSG